MLNFVNKAPGELSSISKYAICKDKYFLTISFLILQVITLPNVSNFHIFKKTKNPLPKETAKKTKHQIKDVCQIL